jgi:hypothetical protein
VSISRARPRQRNFLPGGAQLAHVDGNPAGPAADGVKQAGLGLDRAVLPAGFFHDQRGDTARCVAAGLDLAAVGVADSHEDVRRAIRGRLHDDQLVAADAGATVGHGAGRIVVEDEGLRPGVDHHEIVAETVHLYEGPQAHAAGYRAQQARRLAPIRSPWNGARAADDVLPLARTAASEAPKIRRWL